MKNENTQIYNEIIKIHQNQINNLQKENERLRQTLKLLRKTKHYQCEDPWYSCPMTENDATEDRINEKICDCGKQENNDIIDNALKENNTNKQWEDIEGDTHEN